MSHPDVQDTARQAIRVLVTGASRPAAVSVIKSLSADPSVLLMAADADPWAAGLYLVPPQARMLIPAGLDPSYADTALASCLERGVDVLIPTAGAELRPLARARGDFARAGVEILLAPDQALDTCLDGLALARRCAGHVPVPRTERLGWATEVASWTYPAVVKPRTGGGPRHVTFVESADALARMDMSGDLLVQQYLPGVEYSVDVLADASGHVVASVPRVHERVASGVSFAGRTVHDGELERLAAAVAVATGLVYVASVQFRRDANARPVLLAVDPRFTGMMPLTVASGVDMPRLAVDSLRGRPLPSHVEFREVAMVRYLDERIIEVGELLRPARRR